MWCGLAGKYNRVLVAAAWLNVVHKYTSTVIVMPWSFQNSWFTLTWYVLTPYWTRVSSTMGRHSSDSEDDSRSKKKKKKQQQRRCSSSSSSSSSSSGSRMTSSRSKRSTRRSRSRSRDKERDRRWDHTEQVMSLIKGDIGLWIYMDTLLKLGDSQAQTSTLDQYTK